MTGYWAERETDYSRDAVVGHPQANSNWHLFRFEQTGSDFTVAEVIDCGVHVSGSATVDFTPGSLRGLIYLNRMDGSAGVDADHGVTRPARRGTSKASGSGCAISFERWYLHRGLDPSYLPADFSTHALLPSLPDLPKSNDPVHDTSWPKGATDPDGDGIPGAAYQVTGVVSGVRNAVERQWREYGTPVGQEVPARALTFVVPGAYDVQQSVLRVDHCGSACPLLASGSHVANDLPPYALFAFIGRTIGSARVASVMQKATRQDLNADLTACAKVRQMLPHDPSIPASVTQ
jgi:hypothetical protein